MVVHIILMTMLIFISILVAVIIVSVSNVNRFEEVKKNEPRITKEEYKGREGEKETAIFLNQINGYKQVINDIILNDNGRTRQIDHIAITERGVFVIETKNFSGNVYGRENSIKWQQFLGSKKYEFGNPIYQNFGHTEMVKKVLQNKTNEIYSIIVFTRKCKLKLYEVTTKVMYVDEIKEYIENQEKVIDSNLIDEIYKTLMDNRVTNKEYIEDHSYNVKQDIQWKKDKAAQGICPRCYAKLVKRNGSYGEFYGCSNYPKCTYKEKIKQ